MQRAWVQSLVRELKSHMPHGVAKNLKHYLWEFPGGLWLGFQAFTATAQVQSLGRELKSHRLHGMDPPPTAHRPTHTQKQTNPKPKRTVFAEEIMTTTQLAIKKLCSPGILLTQEKIQLPQGSLLILCPAVVEDLGSEPELLCVSL